MLLTVVGFYREHLLLSMLAGPLVLLSYYFESVVHLTTPSLAKACTRSLTVPVLFSPVKRKCEVFR